MNPTQTPAPLDSVVRVEVDPGDRPILFVGDLQGCPEPLERLLEAAAFDPARHRLIPLGDTINRGPDSLATLQRLKQLGAMPIRGNHEDGLLKALTQDPIPDWARRLDLAGTLLSSPDLDKWVTWISSWPHLRRGAGWIAVHAGLHPTLPPEETPPRFLSSVRVCTPAGDRPRGWDGLDGTIPPGFAPWFDYYQGEDVVLFGHWARRGLQLGPRHRGLDTGAVYGGALTGLWWPEDRIVQVPGQKRSGH